MERKATHPTIDLFSEQRILEALSHFTLVELKLKDAIPWEEFREDLRVIRADYSRGDRPPYDAVFIQQRLC